MSEHESREALRERIAAEVWIGSAYPDERDDPLSRRIWHDMPPTDPSARRAYATADRILALLPVAPVVGEREAALRRGATLMALAWEILDDVDNYMSIDGLDREELEELQTVIAGRIAGALAARTPEEG